MKEQVKTQNKEEFLAVIIAAISMFYQNQDGVVPLFRVKSIKKANRR
ncbi:MAG TPA: hypothetical protein VIL03_00640 [Clostridia bacterium]|jgi:hypothetical protein